jgi:ADP-heptose:LPS heptosyltransferase
VIDVLQGCSLNILITGHGDGESAKATALINGLNKSRNVKNLVGQLNFDEYCKVISGAKAVFCVDSVAGHIAGSYDRPTVVVTNGLSKIERWHPLGKSVHLLENKVTCSPCHSNPCPQRACIAGITPQSLINQLPRILEA